MSLRIAPRATPLLACFVCLVCLLPLLVGCADEASGRTNLPEREPSPRAAISFVTAKAVEHRPVWEISGVLEPARTARVAFIVGGRLTKVLVNRGDIVDQGQLLARLDASEVGAGIAQARAAVAAADSQVKLAADTMRRIERLSGEGAVPEVELTKIRHQHESAVALRSQAQGALRMALVKGGQHVLRSPLRGTVLMLPENLGEIVGPGIPQFDIATLDRLRLRGTLPGEAVGRVELGQITTIRTRRELEVEGRISMVLPALDAETHRLPVELEVVPPSGASGLANSFVTATITSTEVVSAVRVPSSSLLRDEEVSLFVVEPGGRAKRRTVTVVAREGDTAIVQGVEPGSEVVDLPAIDLLDGARVRND